MRDNLKDNQNFIQENLNDLAASLQKAIIDILFSKLRRAIKETGVKNIALSGGVAANSGLRTRLTELSQKNNLNVFLPEKAYTTDNAAMIGMLAYYHYLEGRFENIEVVPQARMAVGEF